MSYQLTPVTPQKSTARDAATQRHRPESAFDFIKFHIQPRASELETARQVIAPHSHTLQER
jgi:hypothetical protein